MSTAWRVRLPPGALGPAVGLVLVIATLAGLAWAIDTTSYDIWGGLLVGPVLVLLTVPVVRFIARSEQDPRLVRLFLIALVVKLAASGARYVVAFDVYGGAADAARYDSAGRLLIEPLRQLQLDGLGAISGTRFTEILTGVVYNLVGPTKLGGFFVFAWLAFLGVLLFDQAFRLAAPAADHRRYRLLVLFLPSILYWPSSTGKEAWMLLVLGLASYGASIVLHRGRLGVIPLALGLWGAAVVRPHLALAVVAGLAVAYPLRRGQQRAFALVANPLAKVVGIVMLFVLASVVITQTQTFFGVRGIDDDSLTGVLGEVSRRTGQGGSEFAPVDAASPTGLPVALVTVLFRPLPFEATNVQSFLSSLEGLFLIGLTLASLPRLARFPVAAVRAPYFAYAAGFNLAFVYGFASISNFGILARQRAQVLPLFLALLCMPVARSVTQRQTAPRRPVRQRGGVGQEGEMTEPYAEAHAEPGR